MHSAIPAPVCSETWHMTAQAAGTHVAPVMLIFTTGRDLASARAWTAFTAAGSGMTAYWTVVAVGRPVTNADRSLGPMSLMEALGICRPASVPHQQQLCGRHAACWRTQVACQPGAEPPSLQLQAGGAGRIDQLAAPMGFGTQHWSVHDTHQL